MRKILLTIYFCSILLLVNAQNKSFKGIFGIPMGSNRSEVKKSMQIKQPGIVIEKEKDNYIIFNSGKFGGRSASGIIFKFTDDDRLYEAIVMLLPKQEIQIFDLYDDVVKDLNEAYYTSTQTVEDYKYPYSSDDKGSLLPLEKGYVTMSTSWFFDTRNTPENLDDDDSIGVDILSSLVVSVGYQDGKLIDYVIAKQKAKNNEDY